MRTYSGDGSRHTTLHVPDGAVGDAALSPDGRTVALILGGDEVVVARTGSPHSPFRQLLAGTGLRDVSWSPNGQWVLVGWPAADQWVFVHAVGQPRVAAVSRIAEQFSASAGVASSAGRSAAHFPQLEGWCCTVQGPAG